MDEWGCEIFQSWFRDFTAKRQKLKKHTFFITLFEGNLYTVLWLFSTEV